MIEKIERFRLYKIKEMGLDGALKESIEEQEAEILAENEKSDYLAPKEEPRIEPSGRVHVGRVNLKQGPTNPNPNPNPWEDSQK